MVDSKSCCESKWGILHRREVESCMAVRRVSSIALKSLYCIIMELLFPIHVVTTVYSVKSLLNILYLVTATCIERWSVGERGEMVEAAVWGMFFSLSSLYSSDSSCELVDS
jgi:hypothetical protein